MFQQVEGFPRVGLESQNQASLTKPSSSVERTPDNSPAHVDEQTTPASPAEVNATVTSPIEVNSTVTSPIAQAPKSRRSRNGCQTCRKRKVKCNEKRPFCGNCLRLHLNCVYKPLFGESFPPNWRVYTSSRFDERGSAEIPNAIDTLQVEPYESAPIQNYNISMIENVMPTIISDAPMAHQAAQQSVIGPEGWELELLGEDSLWANLPIFSNFISAQEPESYEPVTAYTVPSSPRQLLPLSPNQRGERSSATDSAKIAVQPSSFVPADEIMLLRHFVDFAVPPILVDVESRWNVSRDALLRLSKSSLPLRNAICAFSAWSLGGNLSVPAAQCSAFYSSLAMNGLRMLLDKETSDEQLKSDESILATIFFLAYTDTIISNSPKRSFELLDRAYALSKSKEHSSSGLYRQLQNWLKLLDAKVVIAGGKCIHLYPAPDIYELESSEAYLSSNANDEGNGSSEPHMSLMESEDILFNSLNRLSYNFYIQTLNFSSRIAQLDKWHRPRDSVEDELEVMIGADKITRDLNALWTRRPPIIDLADKGDQLRQHMTPSLAFKMEQHLRTYSANFHVCFIHLQRVAYRHLKPTLQAKSALSRIIRLAKLSSEGGHALPVSMLWPLMMAACEVKDTATQNWIISKIEGMKEGGNTMRTAALVKEIIKRQESGQRVDAGTVMQEAFGSIFAVI